MENLKDEGMEKKIRDQKKLDRKQKLAPSLFLLEFARLNLGPYMCYPIVPLEVQEAMYQLYIRDKEFWTVPRIASKFAIEPNRTAGIIMMKISEKKEVKRLAKIGQTLDFSIDSWVGHKFGWLSSSQAGHVDKPNEHHGHYLSHVHADLTKLGDDVDFALVAKAYERFGPIPPPHQVPENKPLLLMPARQIAPPTRANKFHKTRLVIVDMTRTKERVPNEEKFIMIRELDGSLRTPSFEERKYLCREWSDLPKKDIGYITPYPADLKKFTRRRTPWMKRTLRMTHPRHTPRGPIPHEFESYKHKYPTTKTDKRILMQPIHFGPKRTR